MKDKSYPSPRSKKDAQLRRMPEILSVRLNDDEKPNRGTDFDKALAVGGATATNVVRALIDAYTRRVFATGKLPSFPLVVIPEDEIDKKTHP